MTFSKTLANQEKELLKKAHHATYISAFSLQNSTYTATTE